MTKHTFFKIIVYTSILIILGNIISTAAQTPTPDREKICVEDGLTIYEAWTKDIPCTPNISATEDTSVDFIPGDGADSPLGMVPDAADYTYLVFSSYQDENWEIVGVTRPWSNDGVENKIRMTNHPESDFHPRLRPGSTQVIFASNRTGNYELFGIDWGGGNLKQLTNNGAYDSQAAWSPDGEQIAFVSDRNGNQEIYLMQPDSSQVTRLTSDGSADFNPCWSANGSQIVWVRAVDEAHGVLYVMNADGSNPYPISSPLRYLQHPSWSGDGTKIAFDFDNNADGWSDLATIKVDGSDTKIIDTGGELYGYYLDYWAGPWPGTDIDLLSTKLSYLFYEGSFYLDKACVNRISFSSGNMGCMNYSRGYDLYPDTALIDITPPTSYVEPLSQYVRAEEFPVFVTGTDSSPAHLYYIQTQYRIGLVNEWQACEETREYFDSTFPAQRFKCMFSGQPGTTVYFRSRGQDWAENWEAWSSEDGDTFTKLYSWKLQGNITDNRNTVIPNAFVATSPSFSAQANTDYNGKFQRFTPSNSITVTVDKTGYGDIPDISFSRETDQSYTWVLPPLENLVTNGSFENGLDSWIANGNSDVNPNENIKHTGSIAAEFGYPKLATNFSFR